MCSSLVLRLLRTSFSDALVPQFMEEQLVSVTPTSCTTDDAPIPPILDDEQMLLKHKSTNVCICCCNSLRTRPWCSLPRPSCCLLLYQARVAKPVDEWNALIKHDRQLVQTSKEKLASPMRDMQEIGEHAAAQDASVGTEEETEAQNLTSLLLSDYVQHIILHFLRREGDCSECSKLLRFIFLDFYAELNSTIRNRSVAEEDDPEHI